MKTVEVLERFFILLFSCFENLVHGGVIFGWPSLVFVFIQLGYFSDLCSNTNENITSSVHPNTTADGLDLSRDGLVSCPEQESGLQLVFSIAVAIHSTSMFPVGFLFHRFGTRLSRVVMSILLLIGYLLMAFSSTHPVLVFPGTICFTIGGVIMLFSSMQIGNLFGGQKSTVISLINAMYSGSVIVFFIVKIAHDAEFSIKYMFFILAASVVLPCINTFLILPTKYIPWPLPEGYRLIPCCAPRTEQEGTEEGTYDNSGYLEDTFSEEIGVNGHYNRYSRTGSIRSDASHTSKSGRRTSLSTATDPTFETAEGSVLEAEEQKKKEYGTLGSCLLSFPFFMLLHRQVCLETDLAFTVGTVNFFLTKLSNGDEDLVSWYTNVFAITQFFTIIFGPLGGLLMDRNNIFKSCSTNKTRKDRGPYAEMRDSCLPLAMTTLASIGYSVCLLIPNLQLQYLTFIFILILKSLLFGVGSAVVAVVFPMKYFTSVYGAIRTISGFFTFLQYPIFILIQKYLDDDPFWVTVAFIIADVSTFILPVSLYVRSQRRNSAPDEK